MTESRALDELKKVDHLVFVTLKYTRTVDIIVGAIERMIVTLNLQFEDTLMALHDAGKIKEVPVAPVMRAKVLEQAFPKDRELKDIIDFYYRMKKILAGEFKKKEEFRKNVALVSKDGEVNIETLKEYVASMKNYINYLDGLSRI